MIVNCDDYKCHKTEQLKVVAEQLNMFIYHTKGGLTPKFQVLDCAANALVHRHVVTENMQRMLTARTASRGYPVGMTRVELAHCVHEAWNKVPREVLMRSAVKCGIARWFDFTPHHVEQMGLRNVKVDPIIADLVSRPDDVPIFDASPLEDAALYDLGSLLGLDAEFHEDREELENILDAQEDLEAARQAAEIGLDPDELDIDADPSEPVQAADQEAPVGKKRRERQMYSEQQLEVLNRELLRGGLRMKNADIAREISNMHEGAREVSTSDVRNWFGNYKRRHAP